MPRFLTGLYLVRRREVHCVRAVLSRALRKVTRVLFFDVAKNQEVPFYSAPDKRFTGCHVGCRTVAAFWFSIATKVRTSRAVRSDTFRIQPASSNRSPMTPITTFAAPFPAMAAPRRHPGAERVRIGFASRIGKRHTASPIPGISKLLQQTRNGDWLSDSEILLVLPSKLIRRQSRRYAAIRNIQRR